MADCRTAGRHMVDLDTIYRNREDELSIGQEAGEGQFCHPNIQRGVQGLS